MNKDWTDILITQILGAPKQINQGRIIFKPVLCLSMMCAHCGYNLSQDDEYAGWHWDGAGEAAHAYAENVNHCPKCDQRIDNNYLEEEEA